MQYLLITTRLDRSRTDRSIHLMREIGIEPTLIYGVEKGNLPDEIRDIVFCPSTTRRFKEETAVKNGEIIKTKSQVSGLTPGEDAVALSHLKALRHVVQTKEPAIIFEDDFRLWVEGGVHAHQVKQAFDTIPKETDFECFAKRHVWHEELNISEHNDNENHRIVTNPIFANQAYYVSVNFASCFFYHAFPVRAAADVIWRYPPKNTKFTYRHYFRHGNEDGLIWHADSSLKD